MVCGDPMRVETELALVDVLEKIRKPFEKLKVLTAMESESQKSTYLLTELQWLYFPLIQ